MEARYNEKLLVLNNSTNTVYFELKKSLESCKKFYFNVAFISYSGIQLFLKILEELQDKKVNGKVITSTYLNFSDPKALKKLYSFNNIDMKVYNDVQKKGFHSKAYIFEYDDFYKVIIGSSNITASALKSNIEWNVEIISKKDDIFILEVIAEFTDLWDSLDEITESFLDEYDTFIKKIKERNKQQIPHFRYHYTIQPNSMQRRAIMNLQKLREHGEKKALVIAATGTGKTYMSAFDVKQYKPEKVLFIVHREEILNKAEESFKKVFGEIIDIGYFTGKRKEYEAKYIFSTIQTLYQHFEMFDSNQFDYIIIDEAHHIAGDSYLKVLDYFRPNFLLGMTATPERCDKIDIFDMFDNNIAIEVRLHEAMEEELVVPFHYFGISDISGVDLDGIELNNTVALTKALKINQRVDYIIKQMELYGYDGSKRKCLGFCASIDHAQFMSREFNKRGIESVCLSGADSSSKREVYIKRLEDEDDLLEVIFTVDIFNEGIDIPSINLVLMLRPTNSPIIFIQQLGRGLRKSKDKEYLTVLDFIGNHKRAFLIALALKGGRYYDKDSLKVSVNNEFMNIPGDTFVQLDKTSKERILKQLEMENFNSMRYLKEEYLSFKSLLKGKIPMYLMDYFRYDGAPDPIKFIQNKDTYIQFLLKVEKKVELQELVEDKEFMKYIKYLSYILPLKRPFEFALLLDILKMKELSFDECKSSILKYIEDVKDESVLHAIKTVNFDYYDGGQKERWKQVVTWDGHFFKSNEYLESIKNNELKMNYILDILHYGLARYRKEFEEINYGIPFFKLYEQYSMQEVALVSNYRKKHSSFRGSGLFTINNEYFIFVNLHKESNIKESINYKDKFIGRKLFQWQSPNSMKQLSERGENIIFNKKRHINLHLFVRKFEKIDGVVQPYIYVGKMNTKEYKGDKPITVIAKLEFELPAKIYEELVNKVEVKNDTEA